METLMSPPKSELEKPESSEDTPPTYGNSGFMGWFRRLKENTHQESVDSYEEDSSRGELTSEERLFGIIKEFNQSQKRDKELNIQSREAILSDSTHIENQEISFIDQREHGHLGVNLKLTQRQFEKLVPSLQDAYEKTAYIGQANSGSNVTRDKIQYESFDGEDDFTVCEAYRVDYNGMTIKVASPPKSGMTGEYDKRAAIGLVCIDIPYDKKSEEHLRDVEETLNDIMINVLGVPEGLSTPTPEAERQYKEFRYRWHHKLPEGPMVAEQSQEAESLERREVFPGYHTMVSEGKHEEYEEEYGEFASFHKIASTQTLGKILQGYGLMSSHERFRRGMLLHGMSSSDDFNTGGADSVFVRTYVEDAHIVLDSHKSVSTSALLVFEPEIFDRTDWYSYSTDQYGRTSKEVFKDRQSPEDLFKTQKNPKHGYVTNNEQMFRTGIALEHIKAIASSENEYLKRRVAEALGKSDEEIKALWKAGPDAVREAIKGGESLDSDHIDSFLYEIKSDYRLSLIDELHEQGIQEVNGKPLEEFIVAVKTLDDLVDITHDREPRSSIKEVEPEETKEVPENPQEAEVVHEETPEKIITDEDKLDLDYDPYTYQPPVLYPEDDFLEDDLFDLDYSQPQIDVKPKEKI